MTPEERDEWVKSALLCRPVGGATYLMAGAGARLVKDAGADEVDHSSQMAHLTMLLINARAVIEFVIGRPGRKGHRRWHSDDVSPRDLGLDNWSPPMTLIAQLEPKMRQIDKDLAHLSHTRARISLVQWQYGKLVKLVLESLARVEGELHQRSLPCARHLAGWTRTARRNWNEAVSGAPPGTLAVEAGPLDHFHVTPIEEHSAIAAALLGPVRQQIAIDLGKDAMAFRFALLEPPPAEQ